MIEVTGSALHYEQSDDHEYISFTSIPTMRSSRITHALQPIHTYAIQPLASARYHSPFVSPLVPTDCTRKVLATITLCSFPPWSSSVLAHTPTLTVLVRILKKHNWRRRRWGKYIRINQKTKGRKHRDFIRHFALFLFFNSGLLKSRYFRSSKNGIVDINLTVEARQFTGVGDSGSQQTVFDTAP